MKIDSICSSGRISVDDTLPPKTRKSYSVDYKLKVLKKLSENNDNILFEHYFINKTLKKIYLTLYPHAGRPTIKAFFKKWSTSLIPACSYMRGNTVEFFSNNNDYNESLTTLRKNATNIVII